MLSKVEVLTLGTVDCPHKGHFNLLRRAKSLGDRLVVALNTDEFVASYKGGKPVMSLDERATAIENCKFVDAVIVNEDKGVEVIRKLNPDWIVIGSDWLGEDYLKQLGIEDSDIKAFEDKIIYVPRTEGISTAEFKKRVYLSYHKRHVEI